MTKYFYARSVKNKFNPETGKEELFLEVPVIVTPETDEVSGKRVTLVKIGGWHMPCFYAWIPEGYYLAHKRDIEAQAKADARRSRCWVDDGEGGRIRCPECRSCNGCPNAGSLDFDNGHDASYEGLQENGLDAESGEEVESSFDTAGTCFANPEASVIRKEQLQSLSFAFDILMERLAEKKPKYAAIFAELRKGVEKPSDIARNAGLKANRTCEDLPKVIKLAETMLTEIMQEYHINL